MFSNVLVSGHIPTSSLVSTMVTGGETSIQESDLIRALMRTNYLYFYDGHGFVRNIFDFAPGARRPSHFLKIELLDFLARNRKKVGTARYEGYFGVEYLIRRFAELGFPEDDILSSLELLLAQNLILADHLRSSGLGTGDLVRIHVSGFIHLRLLSARIDYLSACALVTPLASETHARDIASGWQISPPHSDVAYRHKLQSAQILKSYLEGQYRKFAGASPFFAEESHGTRAILRQFDDAIGFSTRPHGKARDAELFD